jgi:cardiolipin synthase
LEGAAVAGPTERDRHRLARVLGLRRERSEPPETRSGQPLHPLTVPNLVGCLRLVLLAVFLAAALSSGDGRDTFATVCFAVAAGSDWLDGMLARLTGQYSRLGTLLDPFVDRALVLSGIVVTWHFELLPRWGLAILAARELFMIVIVLAGLLAGLDIKINWTGRISVWPTMSAIGLTLIADFWLAEACLWVGLAGSLVASGFYVRDGLKALKTGRRSVQPPRTVGGQRLN